MAGDVDGLEIIQARLKVLRNRREALDKEIRAQERLEQIYQRSLDLDVSRETSAKDKK